MKRSRSATEGRRVDWNREPIKGRLEFIRMMSRTDELLNLEDYDPTHWIYPIYKTPPIDLLKRIRAMRDSLKVDQEELRGQ